MHKTIKLTAKKINIRGKCLVGFPLKASVGTNAINETGTT